ncbi:hypothetical protein BJ165DRAFT_1530708 [Panaeolus papilionaceus]|nr:hypothetical protein BJ165DRAFT_1530708 [Panaeolus papilionaceus]
MALSILPRTKPFSSLVSKGDLLKYLTSTLLRVLCCPRATYAPFEVDEPTNLVSFIRLLIALCQTFACPGHWLAEFAQNMINDTMVTNAKPFDGILPVKQLPAPAPTERKINLKPYQLELETILVTIKDALPFHLSFPPQYASSLKSSKSYTTHIISTANLPYDHAVHYSSACLLLYKADPSVHTASFLRDLPSKIPELIESKDGTIGGVEVQVVSMVDFMDFERGVVSWRMSEASYGKMKEEKWDMIVWVSNRRQTVSRSVPASEWIQGTEEDFKSTASI